MDFVDLVHLETIIAYTINTIHHHHLAEFLYWCVHNPRPQSRPNPNLASCNINLDRRIGILSF